MKSLKREALALSETSRRRSLTSAEARRFNAANRRFEELAYRPLEKAQDKLAKALKVDYMGNGIGDIRRRHNIGGGITGAYRYD